MAQYKFYFDWLIWLILDDNNYITYVAVLQEDPSDCGRACSLVRPTVLSVALLTALTLAITVLVAGDTNSIHWPPYRPQNLANCCCMLPKPRVSRTAGGGRWCSGYGVTVSQRKDWVSSRRDFDEPHGWRELQCWDATPPQSPQSRVCAYWTALVSTPRFALGRYCLDALVSLGRRLFCYVLHVQYTHLYVAPLG